MIETHEYLTPDYYFKFACKMGACRAACCEGWPISLSMLDYFKLLGVDCGADLRRRLDCAMYVKDEPTSESYARIAPRFDGNCPLRLPDGRCAVHAELGEGQLPLICRLYPRAPRREGDYECSCANSCEAVLELMFKQDAPITFQKRALAFDLPPEGKRTVFFETVGREQEIRLYLIKLVQDRSMELPERLMAFDQRLCELEEALNSSDAARVDALLAGGPQRVAPLPQMPFSLRLELGLGIARRMVDMLGERSGSIRRYGEFALNYFVNDDREQKYERARAHFEAYFPKWPARFEHMLVNHMFFERFPFQDRPESLSDEFVALCGVYALLRFLSIGYMSDKTEDGDFVDMCAAAFRHIDHTSFDRYASHMLRKLGCDTREKLYALISL